MEEIELARITVEHVGLKATLSITKGSATITLRYGNHTRKSTVSLEKYYGIGVTRNDGAVELNIYCCFYQAAHSLKIPERVCHITASQLSKACVISYYDVQTAEILNRVENSRK